MTAHAPRSLFDREIVITAIGDSFRKLTPRHLLRNPVMLVVAVGSLFTTLLLVATLVRPGGEHAWFIFAISLWLWFTVLFANFAEAMAEGRGRAQAAELRKTRQTVLARRLKDPDDLKEIEAVAGNVLKRGDLVIVAAGEVIPGDGEIIQGVASVDESAITGESAPVIREAGGDRSAVTGGTRVLSDTLIIRISANAGETFLDRMINLIEAAKRQKTPNELALDILLAALTIVFLTVTVTLLPFSIFSVRAEGVGTPIALTVPINRSRLSEMVLKS